MIRSEPFHLESTEEESAPRGWDEQLCALGGPIFHSVPWSRFSTARQRTQSPVFFRLLGADGSVLGQALGFVSRAKFGLGSVLTLDALPTVCNGDRSTLLTFLDEIERYGLRKRIDYVSFGSYAAPPGAASLWRTSDSRKERFEFFFDLQSETEAEQFSRFPLNRRSRILQAERRGITVREQSDAEGIRLLWRVQADSAERIKQRGGPDMTVSREGDAGFDPLQILLEAGVARLYVVWSGGAPLSAAFYTCFSGQVYNNLSGHSREGLRANSGTALNWRVMCEARAAGFREFNLGGCSADAVNEGSPEHGVYSYKKSMGAEIRTCVGASRILRPCAFRLKSTIRRLAGRSALQA